MPAAGFRSATYYKWQARFCERNVPESRRLKAFKDRNARYKRTLAEAMLDNLVMRKLLGRKLLCRVANARRSVIFRPAMR